MTPALVAATAVLLGVTLLAERREAPWLVGPKAAASSGYIGVALVSDATDDPYGRWVLAALALAWVGDVAFTSQRRLWFRVGLLAFLLAHVAYVVAFGVLGMRAVAVVVALMVLAAVAAAVGRWLFWIVPRELRVPVVAYVVVISVMVAAASGAACAGAPWLILPAAGLFYLSDLLVARERFVVRSFANRAASLPIFYTAQVLFALSVGVT
jgi:uncharacterized membrane protein YhhN